jgi:hypothetical protein
VTAAHEPNQYWHFVDPDVVRSIEVRVRAQVAAEIAQALEADYANFGPFAGDKAEGWRWATEDAIDIAHRFATDPPAAPYATNPPAEPPGPTDG